MRKSIFDPNSTEPYVLSRSRVYNFLDCPRCFYLTQRLGIRKPDSYPFNLNIAVDELLKNEFDGYRKKQEPHPIQVENNLNAIPYEHPELDNWRESLRNGVKRFHEPTNLLLRGGIDDVWIDKKTNQLIVVDYKATSKKGEVGISADWQDGYRKQIEFYQWLFRGNSFDVSDTGYFVYCNGIKDKAEFNNKLEFKVKLIPYIGEVIAGEKKPYKYLVESIENFINQDELIELMRKNNFTKCKYRNLSGGIVAIHSGWKI